MSVVDYSMVIQETNMDDIKFEIKCENTAIKVWGEDLMRQFVQNLYEHAPRKQRKTNNYIVHIRKRHVPNKTKEKTILPDNEFIIFEHFNKKKSIRLQLFQIADLCVKHMV